MPRSAYRKIQPFGQIPAIEDGNLVLFESGAIVLHVAERITGLLPDDAVGRARATQWMFAALNTIGVPSSSSPRSICSTPSALGQGAPPGRRRCGTAAARRSSPPAATEGWRAW